MPDPDNAFGKRTRLELPEATEPDSTLRRPGRGWLVIFSAAIGLVIVMTFITVSGWRTDTARTGGPTIETTGSSSADRPSPPVSSTVPQTTPNR